MPLLKVKVMNVADAMILGLASKNPAAAKRHISRLSRPEYRSVANLFIDGEVASGTYQRNRQLVESMIEFSGQKPIHEPPKRKSGRIKLKELVAAD